MPIQVGILGAEGRMGKAVREEIEKDPQFILKRAWEKEDHPSLKKEISPGVFIEKLPSSFEDPLIDVLIDFSHPSFTLKALPLCIEKKIPMVIGTTGFSLEEEKRIYDAGEKIPILFSSNMSLGVNILFYLASFLSKKLSPDIWQIELLERHHKGKKDAPSGTAKTLERIFRENFSIEKVSYGREGKERKREDREMGVFAIRGGSLPGEHTIFFLGEDEELILLHRAYSRRIFARGALIGAKWVYKKSPGVYSMQEVLGLR